jgi:hypothetical protein
VKVGAATVRVIVVVSVSEPEVPVMVRVLDPIAAVLATVNKMELLYVVGFGEMVAVTPLGKPEIDKFTLPLKPFSV